MSKSLKDTIVYLILDTALDQIEVIRQNDPNYDYDYDDNDPFLSMSEINEFLDSDSTFSHMLETNHPL